MSMSGAWLPLPPAHAELKPLFAPITIGAIEAPHRVLMAPLTRNRAHGDGTPKTMAIDYYRQRASAGLIITEATQVSPMGKGYIDTPGIHEATHIAAWRMITDAVHEAEGRIFLQLWHVGRISHTSLLPDGAQPLAPSAIRAKAQTFTENGFEDVSDPKAMSVDEIKATIDDYASATRAAMAAGFDGVEIHAANGYLIDQFIRSGSNHRDDDYGGSVENRLRFVFDVVDAVTDEIGADRTGIRLSPTGGFNDMSDANPGETFGHLATGLSEKKLAYLHVVEQFGQELSHKDRAVIDHVRAHWDGVYIGNGDYDAASGAQRIGEGNADAIAFGRPFLANPDLPKRFAVNAPLNEPDRDTFYGGDEKGYTDYPFLEESFVE